MTNRLIRLKEVMAMTGKARSTIYADMANNKFPHSIHIGARSVAWLESDISNWIEQMLRAHADRRTEPAV
jgi:prophage regulatory protein